MRGGASTTVVGIDEAGRGSWIGPLVVGAVALREGDVPRLRAAGAQDSKALSPARREAVYAAMAPLARFGSVAIEPAEIDRHVRHGGLNELEAKAFALVAQPFGPARLHVDACDVDARRFGRAVARHAGPGYHVLARHHADADDPIVGAASIVAKVRRDRAIRELAGRLGVEVGSGYPSDARTVEFVRAFTHGTRERPAWLRLSWATTQRVIGGGPTRTLERFAP